MASQRFVVDADTPLVGDVDVSVVLSRVPPGATVKGMFLTRFVNAIGEDWEEIEDELDSPPKHGRYTAFEDYPTADYLRLLDRAARNRFPRQSTREAYRLLGRGDVEVFGESTLGKVTFSMIKEPGAALARYPEIIKVLTRGMSTAEATSLPDKKMKLVFARYVGAVEQTLGALEGLVIQYDARPTIEVVVDGERAEFTASWG